MRYLMAALPIVACPCHLPLLLVLLGGTAFGAGLSEHMAIAFIALTALFGLSAWAALRMFKVGSTRAEAWPNAEAGRGHGRQEAALGPDAVSGSGRER